MPAPDEQRRALRVSRHEGTAVLLFPSAQTRAGREKKCRACAPKMVRIGAAGRSGVSAAGSRASHDKAVAGPDRLQESGANPL